MGKEELKRSQIIQGAFACFQEHGYTNSSIDEIAAYCGMSKGTIYYYFNTKEELLLETVKSFTCMFNAELETLKQNIHIDPDDLYAFTRPLLDFYKGNQGLFNLFIEFWAQSDRRDEVSAYWMESLHTFKTYISALIHSGIQQGIFRDIDVDSFVWAFMAAYEGIGAYASFSKVWGTKKPVILPLIFKPGFSKEKTMKTNSSLNIHILYFSSTGNARWVCEQLSHLFAENNCRVSLFEAIKDAEGWPGSADLYGIVHPVWCSDIPDPILQQVAKLPPGNGEKFFIIGHPGVFSGDTQVFWKRKLEKKGYDVILADYFCLPINTVFPGFAFWNVPTGKHRQR